MFDIARDIIKAVGNGEYVPSTLGADRPIMRDSLIAVLKGIKPTEDERLEAALGFGNPRRVRAYDRGIVYLREAYNTVIADCHTVNIPHS